MGLLTRAQILTEAAGLAQRPVADVWRSGIPGSLGNGWLQRWLNAVAASWAWPQVYGEGLTTATSAASLLIGTGSTVGITANIKSIYDNIWAIDNATSKPISRIPIRHFLGMPVAGAGIIANGIGLPQECRLLPAGNGAWNVYLSPAPDKNYKFSFTYWQIPTQLASDTSVPWYPNDETIVQAMAYKTHEWYDGKDSEITVAAQQVLSQALANDRIRYGAVNGLNDVIQLSGSRFRNAGRL